MSGTSVPSPIFGPAGFVMPPETDVLTGMRADIDAAMGGGLNPALESPQGQLATSFTAMVGDRDSQVVALFNGVDPAHATGRQQDGIARIYFLERKAAQPTTHPSVLCTGQVGAQIPTGALAKSQDETIFFCAEGGTFGDDGTVHLPFTSTVTGPIPLPTGALSKLYQIVPGWDSLTNETDGVIGSDVESPIAFEARRAASVAKNSRGTVSAIQAEVLDVAGVLDAYTTENDTDAPVTIDGVTVPAHAIFVSVAGGDPQAVAEAIWRKKGGGCDYSGDTTETVEDTQSGYVAPFPSYVVKFQTAVPETFVVNVSLSSSALIPGNASTLIADAVLAAFSGSDGGQRARIGGTLLASRFYSGIATLGTWAQIVSVKIGSSGNPAAAFTAAIAGTVMTVSAVTSGALAVGQTVMGEGLPDGVRIASLGSGTGGTGTYNLNLPQTISSEAMTTVAANLDQVTVGKAHVPVLAAPNITTAIV